jgi:hypothetical protein
MARAAARDHDSRGGVAVCASDTTLVAATHAAHIVAAADRIVRRWNHDIAGRARRPLETPDMSVLPIIADAASM